MPASAYHLFKALYDTKSNLSNSDKSLEKYTLPDSVVATYGGKGQFPDMILRRNGGNGLAGGEMIEIKEAKDSYNITSFNSTVPSAKKRLSEVVVKGGRIYKALVKAGEKDHPFSLDTYICTPLQSPHYHKQDSPLHKHHNPPSLSPPKRSSMPYRLSSSPLRNQPLFPPTLFFKNLPLPLMLFFSSSLSPTDR